MMARLVALIDSIRPTVRRVIVAAAAAATATISSAVRIRAVLILSVT
jgi:hypothetical protein